MKLVIALCLLWLPCCLVAADRPEVTAPPAESKIPSIYTKYISADGYPITASEQVSDFALKEAAFLIHHMLAHRPEVRDAMVAGGSRFCILAHDQFTTDLPEFAKLGASSEFAGLPAKDYWDARARGTGGSERDPYCSCGEENLLGYPGDPYAKENILIHEFAHNMHLRGLNKVDPTFDQRVKKAFEAAKTQGLWLGKYAASNHHEYFAEGAQSWFDTNREDDHDHNHVNTRTELQEYDPALAALCREVFGDTTFRYSKPQTRLTGHLEGFDVSKAPKFVWPERLKLAQAQIKQRATDRAAAASTHETRVVAGWKLHIHKRLLTEQAEATQKAIELLTVQLDEIIRVVPPDAVEQLRQVPLWFSPEYPKVQPRAEYHPGAGWLRDNGRDPAMVKSVEFTNIRTFEPETRRMPNFALHELAHAYHDRVLGFNHPEIKAAYEKAKASGKYDKVDRKDSEGRVRQDRAYAMTNPMEYFAESSEAYFTKNDFFPFDLTQLKAHDPEMVTILEAVWSKKK